MHADFLREMRKQGKAKAFEQARARIMQQTYNDMRWAYHNKTMTWKEFRQCCDYMREVLSYESLIGIQQLSIFDQLTDEKLVETMTEK